MKTKGKVARPGMTDDQMRDVPRRREHAKSTSNAPGQKDQIAPLIEKAERLAKQGYDGHLAILRFTSGWKAILGTPQFDDGLSLEELIAGKKGQVARLEAQPTPGDALHDLLAREGGT